jgi:hypothetical protein
VIFLFLKIKENTLIQIIDENQVVYFSSNKYANDIVELFVNRDGSLHAKITCPKDRTTTIDLGKIQLPDAVRKVGKKIFRSHTSKWMADNIDMSSMLLRFGAGNSFQFSFKMFGRTFERKGKFRMSEVNLESVLKPKEKE